jgi:RNA polymerase sigma-70 factor (ECF subfamily)
MNAPVDNALDSLISRLADGDRAAFTAAFKILWPPTLRLCTSMLKNDADAADAAQQAMESILARSSEYDRARPAMPWALGIAAWQCRTLARKRSRRREEPEEMVSEHPLAAAEELLIERDLARAAFAALGQLSELDRETLLSTFLDEGGVGSGPTLRKRKERAVDRLRTMFKRLYGID